MFRKKNETFQVQKIWIDDFMDKLAVQVWRDNDTVRQLPHKFLNDLSNLPPADEVPLTLQKMEISCQLFSQVNKNAITYKNYWKDRFTAPKGVFMNLPKSVYSTTDTEP